MLHKLPQEEHLQDEHLKAQVNLRGEVNGDRDMLCNVFSSK
jgi:hypothetical protein